MRLTGAIGLHPALAPLDNLLQTGHLGVVPGVGYPNSNRSHFESMATWHSARTDADDLKGYGWLGRAMDPIAGQLLSIGGTAPAVLRGRRSSAVAFKQIEEMLLSDVAAAKAGLGQKSDDDLLAFVQRQVVDAHTAAEKLSNLAGDKRRPSYPSTELAERLQIVATLLKANVGERVFYIQQSGYDTHSQQQFTHATLLAEFAGAVAAFFADLKDSKLDDRVTLMSFSEFGRTIQENGSAGTDHGTAGVCFVAGPTVKGGLIGDMPSLTELADGEPKMTIDFRRVYAALLDGWLGLPTEDAWVVASNRYHYLPKP